MRVKSNQRREWHREETIPKDNMGPEVKVGSGEGRRQVTAETTTLNAWGTHHAVCQSHQPFFPLLFLPSSACCPIHILRVVTTNTNTHVLPTSREAKSSARGAFIHRNDFCYV